MRTSGALLKAIIGEEAELAHDHDGSGGAADLPRYERQEHSKRQTDVSQTEQLHGVRSCKPRPVHLE